MKTGSHETFSTVAAHVRPSGPAQFWYIIFIWKAVTLITLHPWGHLVHRYHPGDICPGPIPQTSDGLIIQILYKYISLFTTLQRYNFAYATTAVLSWHVQNFNLIGSLLIKWKHKEYSQLWAHKWLVKWNPVHLITKPAEAFAWQHGNPLVLSGLF